MKTEEWGFAAGRGSRRIARLRGPLRVSGRTAGKKINVSIDDEDTEQSHLKRRLVEGDHLTAMCPSLLELTRIAQKVIQSDLETGNKFGC